MIDTVSETCRCSWDDVYEKPVIETLNILCYKKDKVEKEKAEMENYRRTH